MDILSACAWALDHTGVVLFRQAWHDKCMQVSWACKKRLECSHCLHVLSP